MAEGDDLYDDLYEDVDDILLPKAPFQSYHENDSRGGEFKEKEAELNAKVELLQKEVEALQQDKAVLTRNISCLFKTAQMELARKDKQMKELREENQRFKLGGISGPINVRSHLKVAVPKDKDNGVGKKTSEKGHNSSTVGTPDARSSDDPPQFQDKRSNRESYRVVSTDRVAQGSSSSQLPFRGQASECHVFTSEVTIRDTAHEQAVGMDSSEQSNRGLVALESARGSARIHEPDYDGRRQSSDEGINPSRGLPSCSKQRDINPEGTRRTAEGSSNNQRSCSDGRDSRSDRPSDRRLDDGHAKHRSPQRNWNSDRDRSRDRKGDGRCRTLDNRKRQRSVSTERDDKPEDRESWRATNAINRTGSESSRERQRDHSSRYHR